MAMLWRHQCQQLLYWASPNFMIKSIYGNHNIMSFIMAIMAITTSCRPNNLDRTLYLSLSLSLSRLQNRSAIAFGFDCLWSKMMDDFETWEQLMLTVTATDNWCLQLLLLQNHSSMTTNSSVTKLQLVETSQVSVIHNCDYQKGMSNCVLHLHCIIHV